MGGSTARAVVPHMRHGSTAPRQIRTSSNLRKARETAAVLRLDKSTTRQHIKYDSYATRLSYILLLHRFGLKSQEQQASPQKPRSKRIAKKKRDLGKTLVHGKRKWWGMIPPVGIRGEWPETEIRRGPPAPFLSERERDVGRETNEWVWGVGTPLPES